MGERLHEYDIELTDYAVGNIVQYMTERPFARWVGRHIKAPALIDHLRARSDQSLDAPQVRRQFCADEMDRLAVAFEDGPPGGDWYWVEYEPLHRRHINTIVEVRDGLSRQAAEQWSDDCVAFARRLTTERLSLADGIGIVSKWVQRLRKLQLAIGAIQFVPAADVPKGWPQTESTADTAASREALRRAEDIERMRKAILELGPEAKSKSLIRCARIKAEYGVRALQALAELGEYVGVARTPPRNQARD